MNVSGYRGDIRYFPQGLKYNLRCRISYAVLLTYSTQICVTISHRMCQAVGKRN